jgi:hypothetical protein
MASRGDGNSNNNFESGWIGRFMEHIFFLIANFPLGIQLGHGDNSLGFHGNRTRVPEYYRAISFRFLFSGKRTQELP